ncbi:MAG: DUF1453 family protein [Candidatus Eremiobacteraeota bacterium]|nr:DUF1453 family protein [Candidatus Eremiobacteraeota bacterium]
MNTLVLGGISTVVGTTAVLLWRVREGQTPVRLGKIIAPPLGMSTGLGMFLAPRFQVPLEWAGVAFLLGALVFAWPLIYTSRLHKDENGQIWMKRSPIFFFFCCCWWPFASECATTWNTSSATGKRADWPSFSPSE